MKPGGVEGQQSSGQALDGAVCRKQSEQSSEAKPDGFMSSNSVFQSETNPEGTPLEAVSGVIDAEQTQSNSTEQKNWNGAVSSAASGQESKFASDLAVPDGDHSLVQSAAASQHTEHAADGEVLGNSLPAQSAGTPQIAPLQKSELTQSTGSTPKLDRNQGMIKIPQPQTAPGHETGAEKSTGDGAAQKKKKKKQKASVSKKETEKTETNKKAKAEANTCQSKDNSQQAETPQVFKFQRDPIIHKRSSKRETLKQMIFTLCCKCCSHF